MTTPIRDVNMNIELGATTIYPSRFGISAFKGSEEYSIGQLV